MVFMIISNKLKCRNNCELFTYKLGFLMEMLTKTVHSKRSFRLLEITSVYRNRSLVLILDSQKDRKLLVYKNTIQNQSNIQLRISTLLK